MRAPRASGSERVGKQGLVTAVLLGFTLYFALPLYWLAIAATKDTAGLFGSFGLWFDRPRLLANLQDLFAYEDGVYLRWLVNSALYSGVGAVLATLIAAAAGYALAKYPFPGREALFTAILAGVLVPATALALPTYLLLAKGGLTNSYASVLLPSLVSPFGVYLCRIYAAAAVPDELVEAARVDGAGELRIFAQVALRIMTPALVTVFLFQFVGIWNNYFLPLVMLSDPAKYPVTLGLYSWLSFAEREPIRFELTVVGAFVSVIPLVVITAALQRFWRAGITEGSIRG